MSLSNQSAGELDDQRTQWIRKIAEEHWSELRKRDAQIGQMMGEIPEKHWMILGSSGGYCFDGKGPLGEKSVKQYFSEMKPSVVEREGYRVVVNDLWPDYQALSGHNSGSSRFLDWALRSPELAQSLARAMTEIREGESLPFLLANEILSEPAPAPARLAPAADRRLAWVDLETSSFTELDKKKVYSADVLEIGLAVTDCQFNLIASTSIVIHHDPLQVMAKCDDVVREMHEKNGLFADMAVATMTLEEAEHAAVAFLEKHGVIRKGSPMCGNGVTFDRIFTEARMPFLNNFLHYRNLDVSAVKEFMKTVDPRVELQKRATHRAKDDILESIQEAKKLRALLAPGIEAILGQQKSAEVELGR